jgi:hypothetical protein
MDVLVLLEQQHRELADLLAEIAIEPGLARRASMAARAVRLLDAHTVAEQRHLYSACEARSEDERARLADAFEAQALTRLAAARLLSTRPTDERFAARLARVRELFRHHADGDEDWVFQRAKRRLTDEELDRLGDEVERSYAELAGTAAPARGAPVTRLAPRSRRAATTPRRDRRAAGGAPDPGRTRLRPPR